MKSAKIDALINRVKAGEFENKCTLPKHPIGTKAPDTIRQKFIEAKRAYRKEEQRLDVMIDADGTASFP